jgi:hypothetical protein
VPTKLSFSGRWLDGAHTLVIAVVVKSLGKPIPPKRVYCVVIIVLFAL